jgi:hypothetical protein
MYHIEWLQSALEELAAVWTPANSELRRAITASNMIEQRLWHNPRNEGESRAAGRRLTFIPPLAAIFRIEDDNQTVTIEHVQLFGRRKR